MPSGYLLIPESALMPIGFSGMVLISGALVRPAPAEEKLQLCYTNEFGRAQQWAADKPGVQAIRRKKDLSWKWLAHLVLVRRRNSAVSGDNPFWKVLADCTAADFFRVDVAGAVQWRHYRVVGAVPRWRPDSNEVLRDVQDRVIFAGDTLVSNAAVAGMTGQHEPDTGEVDRRADD